MNSVYDFIVKPIGNRYNNSKKINDKELLLNTSIEEFKFINKLAEVISIPLAFKTKIKKGDHVIIHHNVFRRYYDIKGQEKNSSKYFKEDLYFCQIDQIYLYKNKSKWKTFNDRCFLKPLVEKNDFKDTKTKSLVGVLKYSNSSLEAIGLKTGDVLGFTPNSEFEFLIDDELLYCMKSNDIVLNYGYQKNKTEYNPSWAKSS